MSGSGCFLALAAVAKMKVPELVFKFEGYLAAQAATSDFRHFPRLLCLE
jgi:hypothetical protein